MFAGAIRQPVGDAGILKGYTKVDWRDHIMVELPKPIYHMPSIRGVRTSEALLRSTVGLWTRSFHEAIASNEIVLEFGSRRLEKLVAGFHARRDLGGFLSDISLRIDVAGSLEREDLCFKAIIPHLKGDLVFKAIVESSLIEAERLGLMNLRQEGPFLRMDTLIPFNPPEPVIGMGIELAIGRD
jgi:hypothetical protein